MCLIKSTMSWLLLSLVIFAVLTTTSADDDTTASATNSLKAYEILAYNDFRFDSTKNHFKSRKRRSDDNEQQQQQQQIEIDSSSSGIHHNRLSFEAFNRTFNLILKRQAESIINNLDIEVRYSKKPSVHLKDTFSSNFYVGFVEDEPNSFVNCYFEQKNDNDLEQPSLVFAQIQIIRNDADERIIYYIEPDSKQSALNNRYIMYRTVDILTDLISNDNFNQSFCKAKKLDPIIPGDEQELNERVKRQENLKKTNSDDLLTIKNRCHLALVADYRFFKEIGNANERQTVSTMVNIISSINVIYTRTPWLLSPETDDIGVTNYGFSIEKIIVHAEPTKPATLSAKHYNQEQDISNADEVLTLFGDEDWSQYCLAHLFTFQKFEGSVLGLAYVSSPLVYSYGGICSAKTSSGYDYAKQYSVNIGLSSYRSMSDRQSRLLQREAELVTAHEFGHNWGSEHDPIKPECTPPSGANGGNFIMFAYANQGQERNNNYFSPCSIRSIGAVLRSKSKCFKADQSSNCGNYRIEDGEECDAGSYGLQNRDPCCDSKCKLRSNATCSDGNHQCCFNCKIAPSSRKCYSSPVYLDCFHEHSYCDGLNKDCPAQKPKEEGTQCNSFDLGRCDKRGHCLSLCQQRNPASAPCMCEKSDERCLVCCRTPTMATANSSSTLTDKNSNNECRPYHLSFGYPFNSPIYQTNGRACFNGICENKICQAKVKDYVSRFWKVIQNVTVSGFVEFMKRNIVSTIILISLLVWIPLGCCIHFCLDKPYRTRLIQKKRKFMNSKYALVVDNNDDEDDYLNKNDLVQASFM